MEHLSEWHVFDPTDRSTYPKVQAPVQVRYNDGRTAEGICGDFFPLVTVLIGPPITEWRYIKGLSLDYVQE